MSTNNMWRLHLEALYHIQKLFPEKKRNHGDIVNEINSSGIIKLEGFRYDLQVDGPKVAYLESVSEYPVLCFEAYNTPLYIVHPLQINEAYLAAELLHVRDDEKYLAILTNGAPDCPFCDADWGDDSVHECSYSNFLIDFCDWITAWVNATEVNFDALTTIIKYVHLID